MSDVLYTGQPAILEAFDAYGIDTWALLQGKEIIARGNGEEELACWLIRLQYTRDRLKLCLYDSIPNADDIRKNDAPAICVPVRVQQAPEGLASMGGGALTRIEQRMEAIEKRISGLQDDEDGEEGFDILPVIKDYLANPEKITSFISGIMMLAGKSAPPQMAVAGPQPPVRPEAVEQHDQVTRLAGALDRLEKCDPEIVVHLEKLAHIAETNPSMFTMLLKTLDGI